MLLSNPSSCPESCKSYWPAAVAHEETGQHRLADVHRIDQPVQTPVAQAQADFQAEGRLIGLDQVGRGLLIPGANTAQHVREGRNLAHGAASPHHPYTHIPSIPAKEFPRNLTRSNRRSAG